MTNEYYLHYIGNGLYGTKRFIAESKRIGVQRAIPFRLLKHVTWGKPILLALHKKIPLCNKTHHDIPAASIFSYFRIDGLSYQLPDDVKEKLISKLKIVSFEEYGSNAQHEQRACGDYSIGACYFVDNSIEEITSAIESACNETNHNVSDFKYFIKGSIQVLDQPIILEHTKFNRGYRKVSIENLKLDNLPNRKAIFFLYDYNRRMYLKKGEAADYDRTLLDEHKEETKLAQT